MLYNESVEFVWDDQKAASNVKKHGVSFSEAATVWYDDCALEISDPDHSIDEARWIRLGSSSKSRILIVVFCEVKDGHIRIISSRKATSNEKRQYYER